MNAKRKVLIYLSVVAISAYGDLAKFNVVVVSAENGKPIPDLLVSASFGNDNGWKAWTESASVNHDAQKTDSYGRCRLSGKTNNGEVGCWVDSKQDGYYGTIGGEELRFTRQNLFGVWQPDNLVVTIRLHRIEHPIPLFVKSFSGGGSDSVKNDSFSEGNGCLKLDLLKGAYLPPVGNGEYADVEFTRLPHDELGNGTNFNGRVAPAYRDSMMVRFLGEGNGLAEVPRPEKLAGLMIREASLNGYLQEYFCWKGRMKDLRYSSHFKSDRNFVFRIRTLRDEKGQVKSAYYGKIYGDITFKKLFGGTTEVAAPSFLYYLNPTPNDRNLEWDMKNNLCINPGDIGQLQP